MSWRNRRLLSVRSFATETLDRLDRRARELGESRNGLAQRLLDELLRLEQQVLG